MNFFPFLFPFSCPATFSCTLYFRVFPTFREPGTTGSPNSVATSFPGSLSYPSRDPGWVWSRVSQNLGDLNTNKRLGGGADKCEIPSLQSVEVEILWQRKRNFLKNIWMFIGCCKGIFKTMIMQFEARPKRCIKHWTVYSLLTYGNMPVQPRFWVQVLLKC